MEYGVKWEVKIYGYWFWEEKIKGSLGGG